LEAILKFDLPEERSEFKDACDGAKLRSAAQEFDNYLRGRLKYEEMPEIVDDTLSDVRDKLHEIFENLVWADD